MKKKADAVKEVKTPIGSGGAQHTTPEAKTTLGNNVTKNSIAKSAPKKDAAKKHIPSEKDTAITNIASESAKPVIEYNAVSLEIDGDLNDDDASELLTELLQNQTKNHWHIGDLLVALDKQPGEKRDRKIAAQVGLAYGTIANLKSVAKKVPVSLRRDDLSWDHHRVIAKLKNNLLKEKWLEVAALKKLTTRQLDQQLPGSKKISPESIPGAKAFLGWLQTTGTKAEDWDDSRKGEVATQLTPVLKALDALLGKLPDPEDPPSDEAAD